MNDFHPLTKFRETAGLTQAELAERLNVSRWMVNRLERRQRMPSWELVSRIVAVTGGLLSADDFLPRSSNGAPEIVRGQQS